MSIIQIILAIFLPPVACWVVGENKQALISIPLTLLFWIPGVIHAFYTINNAQGGANK